MRDVLKRIERLEQATAQRARPTARLVVNFIQSDGDGHALPFAPTWADAMGSRERIERNADESLEDFKARALGIIPEGCVVLMG